MPARSLLFVFLILTSGACRKAAPSSAAASGFFEENPAGYAAHMSSLWQEALLGGYPQRLCELTGSDWLPAVFIARAADGSFKAVSRDNKDGDEYGYVAPGGARAKGAPHHDIRTTVVELDEASGTILARACQDVLSRYASVKRGGKDGEVFYAAHWTPSGIRFGKIWSPNDHTVASDYVALGRMLWSFVNGAPSDREGARKALVAHAEALSRRIGASP